MAERANENQNKSFLSLTNGRTDGHTNEATYGGSTLPKNKKKSFHKFYDLVLAKNGTGLSERRTLPKTG